MRRAYLCKVARDVCPTCPTCHRPLDPNSAARAHRPFCSERCRSADLSNWLSDSYRISAPLSEEDLDSGLPEGMPDQSDSQDPDVN